MSGTYALALVLTVVVETGLACWLRRDAVRRLRIDVPLMNLTSHPLLWLAVGFGLPVPIGELGVMALETAVYRVVTGLSLRWALALGVGLNAVTWFIGAVWFG